MLNDCRQVQDAEMPSGDAMTPSVVTEKAQTSPATKKAQTRSAEEAKTRSAAEAMQTRPAEKTQTWPAEMPSGGEGAD